MSICTDDLSLRRDTGPFNVTPKKRETVKHESHSDDEMMKDPPKTEIGDESIRQEASRPVEPSFAGASVLTMALFVVDIATIQNGNIWPIHSVV